MNEKMRKAMPLHPLISVPSQPLFRSWEKRPMIKRCKVFGSLVVVLALSSMVAGTQGAERIRMPESPRERAAVREAIRNTPLLERPNRPGHFYGNTVRRITERRG